jgi:hypothetical protein
MNLSELHLPPLRLPHQLLRSAPGIGADTSTVDEPAAALSMFDPLYLGCDLYGSPVRMTLAYRNLLCGGVADSGKSNGAAQVIAHAALCPDVRMWFFDSKWVELGFWQPLAERIIGPVLPDAIDTLTELSRRLDERYEWLLSTGRRKLTQTSRPAGTWSSSTSCPCSPRPTARRPSRRSSPGYCGISSPAAGPPACRSSPPRNGRPLT